MIKNNLPSAITLDEIIDGITDAETIDDTKKIELLSEIEKQGGVVSGNLWKVIDSLFEAEAADAAVSEKETEELLESLRAETAGDIASAEDTQILNWASREQDGIVNEYRKDIAENVLSYIERRERDAEKGAETQSEAANKDTIASLRNSLLEGKSE